MVYSKNKKQTNKKQQEQQKNYQTSLKKSKVCGILT